MFKLSIFNKDQLVQLLSSMVDFAMRNETKDKMNNSEFGLMVGFTAKLEQQA